MLASLSTFLHPRGLLDATPADIEAWLQTCRLGAQGRYSYLSHVHAFFVYLVRREFEVIDPTAKIDRPKLPKRLPRPITPDELDRALTAAGARMRAWLYLGGYAGLRRAEIAHLTREDVLDSEALLRVSSGKGAKDAVVPLNPAVLDALVACGLPRYGPVFRHPSGAPVSPAYVGGTVARFLRDLGIDRTCHSLRHHFGTEAYRLCRDLFVTRDLLRHSSVAVSEMYVAFDPSPEARAVVDRMSPSPKKELPLRNAAPPLDGGASLLPRQP